MSYKDQNVSSYVDQHTSLFSQFERMGKETAIPETHKGPLLLPSIDLSYFLKSTAAAFRTKEPNELTWEYVATTVIDELNARNLLSPGKSSHKSRGKIKRKF